MIRFPVQALAPVLLVLAATNVVAQRAAPPADEAPQYPPVYRVELLVFAHVDGQSDRRRAEAAMDFTGVLDPLLVAAANRRADAALERLHRAMPMIPQPGTVAETTPYLESDSATLRPIPPVYSDLGRLSPRMQRALDRLLESGGFEPLAARSWLQLAEPREATATLRVHDQAVVDLHPPARSDLAPFFTDWLGVPASVATGEHALRQGRFRPAPPLAVYRLDGSARLRRRQFLHLHLDLVWQERAPAMPGTRTGAVGPAAAPRFPAGDTVRRGTDGAREPSPEWQLHRLVQSRVIEPGRVEYFDSSRFGVLALIERFEQVVPEAEPPPANDPGPAADAASPATQSGR